MSAKGIVRSTIHSGNVEPLQETPPEQQQQQPAPLVEAHEVSAEATALIRDTDAHATKLGAEGKTTATTIAVHGGFEALPDHLKNMLADAAQHEREVIVHELAGRHELAARSRIEAAYLRRDLGDSRKAREHFERAYETLINIEPRDESAIATCLWGLGVAPLDLGELAEAKRRFAVLRDHARATRNAEWAAVGVYCVARACHLEASAHPGALLEALAGFVASIEAGKDSDPYCFCYFAHLGLAASMSPGPEVERILSDAKQRGTIAETNPRRLLERALKLLDRAPEASAWLAPYYRILINAALGRSDRALAALAAIEAPVPGLLADIAAHVAQIPSGTLGREDVIAAIDLERLRLLRALAEHT